MGLDGQLKKMPFGEIIQTVSLCKQSGVLTLTHEDKRGRIVFSQGHLLSISVDGFESFGRALVRNAVLTEDELECALALQRAEPNLLPIGEMLKRKGFVPEDVLQVELRKYLVEAARVLLDWDDGSFHFEFGPDADTKGMLLGVGLDFPTLFMEATRPRDLWQQGLLETTESPAYRGEWGQFLSMLSELLGPTTSQEAVLLVLRYASEVLHRTILFVVKGGSLVGAGQSGLPFPEEEADMRIRKVQIPLSDPSLFKEVADRKENYRGVLSPSASHQPFIDQIGGKWPSEVFLSPLLSGDTTIALLYGDQADSGKKFPDTRGLEAFVRIVTVVCTKMLLEKNFLERKGGKS